jgi:hypothetical protein
MTERTQSTGLPPRRTGMVSWLHLCWPLLLMLGLGGILFPSSGRDDVHIAYWSAYALKEFGALLSYSGVPLEQGSSLLHVALLAALSAVTGLAIPDLGTPLSVVFGMLAVIEAGRLAGRLDRQAVIPVMAVAATSTPLVYWSFGALETTLVAFLMTAMLRALAEWVSAESCPVSKVLESLLWGALYLLARPESFFILTAFILAGAALHWRQTDVVCRLAGVWAVLLLFFVALCTWRYLTFDALFPQPVNAKMDHHLLHKSLDGAHYLLRSLRENPVLAVIILACLPGVWQVLRYVGSPPQSSSTLVPAMLGAYLAFIVTSGGDWMEGARFAVPALPLLAVFLYMSLSPYFTRYAKLRWILGMIVLAGVVQTLAFAALRSTGIPIFLYPRYAEWAAAQVDTTRYSFFDLANRVHLRDAVFLPKVERVVDTVLAQQGHATVLSVQGGMVPYYLFKERFGRVRFLDLGGLTGTEFSDCPVLEKNHRRRSSGGLTMGYDFYVAHMAELRDRCGIPYPDVIYDIDNRRFQPTRRLEDSGQFRVIDRMDTDMCLSRNWCPPSVEASMFVAVRIR